MIQPVLMGGTLKEIGEEQVKVHLHGRLGVLTVPRRFIIEGGHLTAGQQAKFFFSYLWIMEPGQSDGPLALDPAEEIFPALMEGRVTEVNDTAIKVAIQNDCGTVAVPRRWVFTDVPLAVGETAGFYFSCLHIVS